MWARQGIGARADSSEACFGRGVVSVTVLKISPVGMLATQGKVDALVTEVANREECWTPTGKKLAGVVCEFSYFSVRIFETNTLMTSFPVCKKKCTEKI